MKGKSFTKNATVTDDDGDIAIAKLADDLQLPDMAGVIFFVSPKYDPLTIEKAIKQNFKCKTIGCTTAGEIGPEYVDGISAISFSAEVFKLHTVLLDLDNGVDEEAINSLAKIEKQESKFGEGKVSDNSLGFLIIDGLSMKEESTVANMHNVLPHLPLLGGSAGDGLNFGKALVFMDGTFYDNAATFTFIETSLDFELFKLQHFEPSDTEFVVTDADTANRIVHELDGEPAAQYFAKTLGLEIDQLSPDIFSINPLMLQIGNDWYVRSIQKVNDDGSLLFYCAIDIGLPLTIGKGVAIEKNLQQSVNLLSSLFSSIELTIGCDCILRRLEIFNKGKEIEISHILREINFCGFSTYGEQFTSLHINQTLTGVIFGKKHND